MAKTFNGYMDWLNRTATRFWSKVDRRGPDECWPWRGTHRVPNPCGMVYGGFGLTDTPGNSININAHRFAYTLAHGEIPEGYVVMHSCDVPLCVNPAHLHVGTQAENVADQYAKGRGTYGEKHGRAKLTAENVRAIRASDKSDGWWAKRLGVWATTITKARTGANWPASALDRQNDG